MRSPNQVADARFAWLVALFGYPSVVILGVPLFLVLWRHDLLRPAPLALAGLVIGMVVAGLFFLVEEKYSVVGMVQWLPFSMRAGVPLAGAVAGLVFWAIAVVRNHALTAGSDMPFASGRKRPGQGSGR